MAASATLGQFDSLRHPVGLVSLPLQSVRPLFSLSSIVLVLFVFLVLYHGRQVEIDSSLDFLWKQQARKELEEMTEMRRLGIILNLTK